MRLAVGVRSADPVFLTVVVHFQVVGHLFTAFAIAQHGHVWRMVKLKEFHAYDFTVTEYAAQAVPVSPSFLTANSTIIRRDESCLRLPRGTGVPLGMSRIHPERPGPDLPDRSVVADVLLRQEPDEEEDEEEDEGNDNAKEEDDDDGDEGYSE